MQHDCADTLFKQRKELRLLRLRDVLDHVVKHDYIVREQVIAVVSLRTPPLFRFRKGNLRIVLKHFEELCPLKSVTAGHDEDFKLTGRILGYRRFTTEHRDE